MNCSFNFIAYTYLSTKRTNICLKIYNSFVLNIILGYMKISEKMLLLQLFIHEKTEMMLQ